MYVIKQLVTYRNRDLQLDFVNLAMRFLNALDGATAVPQRQGLEIHAVSEITLTQALAKCYSFFPGEISVAPAEVLAHPQTGAAPIMHVEVQTPWSCLRHLRLRMLERGASVTASRPSDGLMTVYATAPMQCLLGLQEEVAQLTEHKGAVSMRFSHYAVEDGPPGGSAA